MKQVVKFWASWCGPCKVYNPHWDKYVAGNTDTSIEFISVDVESPEGTEWREKVTVSNIPFTVVLEDDKVVRTEIGALTPDKLKNLIDGKEEV